MNTISKKTALFVGVGLLAVIIGVVGAVWLFAPSPPSDFAKMSETAQSPALHLQEQDPVAELQKLLGEGKAKSGWKEYLETYWPIAAGVGGFIGLVIVVMMLLKRRRLDDDEEEGVLVMMDNEDVSPSVLPEEKIAAEAREEKIKRPWPWEEIGMVVGLLIAVFVAFAALYSFFIITDLEKSVEQARKDVAEKVGRESFDSLGASVTDLKSTTEGLTSKMENTRERLKTAEGKFVAVAKTADEASRVALAVRNDIHGKIGLKWRMGNLELRQTKDYNELSGGISRAKSEVAADLRVFAAKQDSINIVLRRGLEQRLTIAELAALDSLLAK